MIGGPLLIAIGLLILGSNIPYPVDDPRSQPWFGHVVVAIAFLLGLFAFAVGLIRLVLGLRDRGGN